MNATAAQSRLVAVVLIVSLTASADGLLSTHNALANDLAVRVPVVNLTEKTFDQTIFGKFTIIGAELQCGESLQAQIGLIEVATQLSERQRSKLELAGRLDIERFFARYEEVKRTFKFGTMDRNDWQAAIARMREESKPIKATFDAGLHGESSLFAKTLVQTLDQDQLTSVQTLHQVRANRTYAKYIRFTLSLIDPKIPMTKAQREAIMELMLEKTSPPDSYGTQTESAFAVLRRMSEIEDEIRELFSDQEWKVMSELIGRSNMKVPVP